MATSRFFEWFQFAALMCWGLLGLTRALLFHARGIPVIAAHRQRAPSQMVLDALAFICLLVWAYEIVAYAWRFHLHVGPPVLHLILVGSTTIKTVGFVVVVSIAVLLYAIALRRLGNSWRLGIDRTSPGPLVTDGIYRWTRHPIYVAFDLLFVGTFLVLGRLIFLVLASVWIPLLHSFMLREEHFLLSFTMAITATTVGASGAIFLGGDVAENRTLEMTQQGGRVPMKSIFVRPSAPRRSERGSPCR